MQVVMYPDYQGQGGKGFIRKVREYAGQEAIIVPILNGLPESTLEGMITDLIQDTTIHPVAPVVCRATGLRAALTTGYNHILYVLPFPYQDLCVVRLDTAEHDPSYIPFLAAESRAIRGMVIGDLDFSSGGHLESGTPDEFTHLLAFPELYWVFTEGKLPLSCAHGYQAFGSRAVLQLVFAVALTIVARVDEETGQQVTWGFDGAMALAATIVDVPVKIHPVPASTDRNRPWEKVRLQLRFALLMCRAAERVRLAQQAERVRLAGQGESS